jgi:carbamoyl-phosphate synthase small subunit
LVVRELSEAASNWRSEEEISNFLAHHNVPIISDIDTRALVLHLRKHGAMRGVLSTIGGSDADLVAEAKASPSMVGLDLASRVTTPTRYDWTKPSGRLDSTQPQERPDAKFKVAAYDFGIKQNILRRLVDSGCTVTIVPASTSAKDVLELKPDGVFLSNGPGDPEPVDYAARAVRGLLGRVPVFGICLGHQIIGLALGGKTYKLKFGHHGGNHPVMNLETRRVEITAQNHGFAVDPDSLNLNDVVLTHRNLNDDTLEGLRHKSLPLFSVQYHPEASPGPHDSAYLFGKFVTMMEEFKDRTKG